MTVSRAYPGCGSAADPDPDVDPGVRLIRDAAQRQSERRAALAASAVEVALAWNRPSRWWSVPGAAGLAERVAKLQGNIRHFLRRIRGGF